MMQALVLQTKNEIYNLGHFIVAALFMYLTIIDREGEKKSLYHF